MNALTLDVSGSAILQVRTKRILIGDVTMDVVGSVSISVLTASFESTDLTLEAVNDGTICLDAKEATTQVTMSARSRCPRHLTSTDLRIRLSVKIPLGPRVSRRQVASFRRQLLTQ
ncbi:hypothetical protein GN244_ATG02076 [Phytophthora infestans]|uniref:Uncharacterized protein n=1 Tax=Phytophthora infestans TaxID=4787 RepID=A0A833TLX3_PHYIN|nr:hypothetical protein GN244_ATG02076 [Phytophthora infestans]KAF4142445.1 hypothetical protein GN958_ATG08358 [Phytophthora infestans]